MAIQFRGTKGSSLTHNELDQNFREFFYSASYEGSNLKLHKFTAISSSVSVPLTNPVGRNGAIQFKSGNAVSGANAQFTGSQNLTFVENTLKVTGSILLDTQNEVGLFEVTGSGEFTGNLTVGGTLTAEEFVTERNTTIQIYNSGSTIFGDSHNDSHERTGSLKVLGAFNLDGSGSVTNMSGSFSGSFEGEGSGVTGVISSSYAVSASVAPFDGLTGRPTLVSSSIQLSSDISGSVNAATASLINTASATLNVLTFTKGDNSTFTVTVDTGSGGGGASSVVADTSPQLGGNLDLNSFHISGSGAITASNIVVEGKVLHAGDSDTSIDFSSDMVSIVAGGETMVSFREGFMGVTDDVVFNPNQNDIDFGISSDDVAHLFRTDAANNRIGIGTSSPQALLHVTGSISGSSIQASGDITAFYSSDERLKDNVTPIASAIDKIRKIGGYEFDWNDNSEHSGHDVGVIAQEIEKVLPEVVTTRGNGYKAVRYEKIVALLIAALNEQQLQIDELKSKI